MTRPPKKPLPSLHIYMIAGEPSGDQIGADLIKALRAQWGDALILSGIGGPLMEREGLVSLFPMSDLSVMGLTEILPHLPRLLKRLHQTKQDILKRRPDGVVTIDSPGFNFRIARALHQKNIPVIHYTAPSVWAWRPGRARKIAPFLAHLLALFPFEPPYFEKEGLSTTFVGHPLVHMGFEPPCQGNLRARYADPVSQTLVCLLPGSRLSEVKVLLPLFWEALEILAAHRPHLAVLLPVTPSVEPWVRAYIALKSQSPSPFSVQVMTEEAEKKAAMAASDVALAASGTVSLELALMETPMVIGYKVNALTAWIVRRLLLTPYVCLVNILLNEKIVPELLQEQCTPAALADEVLTALSGTQKPFLQKIRPLITSPLGSPSHVAAAQIIKTCWEHAERNKSRTIIEKQTSATERG